jgi:tetratricopeptide (TPR) repeat protein
MSRKKLVSICAFVVLFMLPCGIAGANWLETYASGSPDLTTWQYFCYPDITKTYTHTILPGPPGNHYLSLDETTPLDPNHGGYGSAFGMAIGSPTDSFTDVRFGAVVNVTGDASKKNNYHGLGARVDYFIDDGSVSGAPGLIATKAYVMLINWQDGPTNLRIQVQKLTFNQKVMSTDFEMAVPGTNHARSYYAELDVVGSGPVYVTGSLYEYKGGPLVARLPTMVDTNAKDWWEDADNPQTPINDVLVFTSGVSGIFVMHEGATPPGYHTTFDDISSISNGPAAVNPNPADGATGVSLNADLSWKEAAFATSRALWSQADLIKSHLAEGNDVAAEAAVDRLLTNFNNNPLIAKAIHETAYEYRKLGNYDRANELDQYVIDHWPADVQVIWAKMDIWLGNDAAVEKTIDLLIADFNDNPELPTAIFVIGEEYYKKAFQCENERTTEAKDSFQKAIAIWERIVTELPVQATYTALSYYFAADCYCRLGQYEKAVGYYQKVVNNWPDYEYAWNALFLIGRSYEDLKESGVISKSQADPKIKAAYEQLLEKYPDCPAAKIAQRWLTSHK